MLRLCSQSLYFLKEDNNVNYVMSFRLLGVREQDTPNKKKDKLVVEIHRSIKVFDVNFCN